MNLNEAPHKILIDGYWDLEDLYVFPRTYEQVYYLLYSFLPHDDDQINERIQNAYSTYPWKGGYSAVNFYNQLKYTTPKKQRPRVLSMQYASPGWIELSLIAGVALSLEHLVKSIGNSIIHVNKVYNDIYVGFQQRKLSQIKTKKAELDFQIKHDQYISSCLKEMAELYGVKDVAELNEKTGSPFKSLKILLSLHRRVRTLVEYQSKGKTRF